MRTIILQTIDEIFEVLGGPKNVAALTGANIKAARNWKTYFGAFPSNTYCVLTDELERLGCRASPSFWKMRVSPVQQFKKTKVRAVATNSNRKKTKRAA